MGSGGNLFCIIGVNNVAVFKEKQINNFAHLFLSTAKSLAIIFIFHILNNIDCWFFVIFIIFISNNNIKTSKIAYNKTVSNHLFIKFFPHPKFCLRIAFFEMSI